MQPDAYDTLTDDELLDIAEGDPILALVTLIERQQTSIENLVARVETLEGLLDDAVIVVDIQL